MDSELLQPEGRSSAREHIDRVAPASDAEVQGRLQISIIGGPDRRDFFNAVDSYPDPKPVAFLLEDESTLEVEIIKLGRKEASKAWIFVGNPRTRSANHDGYVRGEYSTESQTGFLSFDQSTQ